MSIWSEIRADYTDEEERVICVDAWLTSDGDEAGKVIAKINIDTKEVIYIDERAKTDPKAQEVIQEGIEAL